MKRLRPANLLPAAAPSASAFPGLDLLPSAVLLLDGEFRITHANPAAEALFESSMRLLLGQPVEHQTQSEELGRLLEGALEGQWSHRHQELELSFAGRDPVSMACVVTPIEHQGSRVLLELRAIDQQLKVEREERLNEQAEANRQLIRNLAHEIKNPLGGIRGAAQLLEFELPEKRLREYTQVIVKESDRLQSLMDRMLTPHRPPHITAVNIHEVLERVRSLLAAEFPKKISLVRDYDASLPELRGDKEQLIQVALNVARNAAQALLGAGTRDPRIVLRTRVVRNITLHKERYRLALDLHIEDNGPGIPDDIRERVFYPLVSGREGGSGLGLTLAQTFVQQHRGTIEVESRPGYTCFKILLPFS
ncbi:MAG TPA: nitrogen regulation protein NR(II) [Burkholderiales bacterium]|jgi:two-component system nitrogen regulation sensor histidine kinase GlnL